MHQRFHSCRAECIRCLFTPPWTYSSDNVIFIRSTAISVNSGRIQVQTIFNRVVYCITSLEEKVKMYQPYRSFDRNQYQRPRFHRQIPAQLLNNFFIYSAAIDDPRFSNSTTQIRNQVSTIYHGGKGSVNKKTRKQNISTLSLTSYTLYLL